MEAGCITASDISKAERGIKELTPEQLEAIAAALGAAPESTVEAEPADAPDEASVSDQQLLDLYRAAARFPSHFLLLHIFTLQHSTSCC